MIRLAILASLGVALLGCASPPGPGGEGQDSDQARYFDSPKQAVPAIATMLRNRDWQTLASYYDLSDSSISREALVSGGYFINADTNAEQSPPPQGELARYRQPFHPMSEYRGTAATDEAGVVVVEVMLEIDQGQGMPPQRVLDEFRMKQHEQGWQILLAERG
jgi:hypothetical protein